MPHLVLTRKEGECVDLTAPGGIPITVKIEEVRNDGRVRIGFDAASNVTIHRREVTQRIALGRKVIPIPPAREENTVLRLPEGVRICGTEWCASWPIVVKGDCTLAYADGKGLVTKQIEIAVEYTLGRQHVAERFAEQLRALGYVNVVVEPAEHHLESEGLVA